MEAELKFEREKTNGVAVVGSYLIDGARRLGIEIYDDCGRLGLCDSCAVTIKSGNEFLTEITKAEIEQLSEARRQQGERLSCQAKIAKVGEIVIMTLEKKDPRTEKERKHEEFRKEFDALPLDQKISQLLELEAVALSETFSFILNSPYTIGGKVVDFMSQFGLKFDKEHKDAKRPEEHKEEPKADTGEPKEKKTQTKRTKKTDPTKENS
ncbi:MAG: 2Fe-2S iron-sulfur cluster-binding protein [Actinomycetota bacterium]